ncbi:hypothetical protein [Brevibacillus reuszeri]|uniref:hypothetical protein n=1 Tax=Brevibacillus reuszeri TaxID=54915 RepID=UPI000CCC1C04|nr:hypothetical protein [Brevibacillus reuszeri]
MGYTILNIEMPKSDGWGMIQINNFSNTFYRFDMVDGKPKLDTSFFADQIENPDEKHKYLSPESDLYKGIQQLLDDYVNKLSDTQQGENGGIKHMGKRRLVEVDRTLHALVNDPLKVPGELDSIAQELLDEGTHFIRGKDGIVIMFLDNAEVHFVPSEKGIDGVIYHYA